jgi:hypothetical protein
MPPPSDDRGNSRRRITAAIAQGLSQGLARESLLIILREVWRHGPFTSQGTGHHYLLPGRPPAMDCTPWRGSSLA